MTPPVRAPAPCNFGRPHICGLFHAIRSNFGSVTTTALEKYIKCIFYLHVHIYDMNWIFGLTDKVLTERKKCLRKFHGTSRKVVFEGGSSFDAT